MASNTRMTWKRRVRKHSNMGKKRKAIDSKRSTPSAAKLFEGLGEPTGAAAKSKPATKSAAK